MQTVAKSDEEYKLTIYQRGGASLLLLKQRSAILATFMPKGWEAKRMC